MIIQIVMAALSIEQIASNRQRIEREIAQRKQLLKAYELVENDLRRSNDNEEAPIRERHRPAVFISSGYGGIMRAVKLAIMNTSKPFTIRDLHDTIANDDISIGSVTTAMNQIREEFPPVVRVKVPGKGRRPTIFEKL
jgi:hypothetical protein